VLGARALVRRRRRAGQPRRTHKVDSVRQAVSAAGRFAPRSAALQSGLEPDREVGLRRLTSATQGMRFNALRLPQARRPRCRSRAVSLDREGNRIEQLRPARLPP
jgi:hypothetical protein